MGRVEIDNLGALVATYRGKGLDLMSGSGLLLIALFLFLVVLPISYGLQRGYYGFTQFGLVPAAGWGLPWLILGALISIPLLIWGFIRWRNSRRFVAVHSGGLHLSFGSKSDTHLAWKDLLGIKYEAIQTFILFIPLPARPKLALITMDQGQLDVSFRIKHLDQLGNQIKEGYYPTVIPTYRQKFRAGQPVSFGPVQIDKMGLQVQAGQYGWENIDEVVVQRGKLVIVASSQKSFKFAVFDIPNLELILTLINERSP